MSDNLLAASQKELWDNVLAQESTYETIVLQFLIGKLDLDYLSRNYSKFEVEKCTATLIEALLHLSILQIRILLSSVPSVQKVSAENIPQFSNFATAVIYLPELLLTHAQLSNKELGYLLFSNTRSVGSAEKYGQNHGSLAVQLGLASIRKVNNKNTYFPTSLTIHYCQLDQSKKIEILQRLCFRIPIIQLAVLSQVPTNAADECLLKTLAKSTYVRRRPNVHELLAFALGE